MGETAKKALTAEKIKAVGKIKREWFEVPNWGGGVFVHGLRAGNVIEDFEPVNVVIASAYDGDNSDAKPVFSDADKAWLQSEAQLGPVMQVYNKALELSGISNNSPTVEDEAKN